MRYLKGYLPLLFYEKDLKKNVERVDQLPYAQTGNNGTARDNVAKGCNAMDFKKSIVFTIQAGKAVDKNRIVLKGKNGVI